MDTYKIYASLKTKKSTRECFFGVFPIDKIPPLSTIYSKEESTYLVVNLDPSYKKGSHWVVICLSNDFCNEFFDSYGEPPPKIISDFLGANVVWQKRTLQCDWTTVCGQWCIYYIWQKCNGAILSEISTGFKDEKKLANDNFVNECFNKNFAGPKEKVIDIKFLFPQIAMSRNDAAAAEKLLLKNMLRKEPKFRVGPPPSHRKSSRKKKWLKHTTTAQHNRKRKEKMGGAPKKMKKIAWKKEKIR